MSGFNSDIEANGDQYHVQTQVTPGGVETLVYRGGQVVYSRRCQAIDTEAANEQHEAIVSALKRGGLNLFVQDDERQPQVPPKPNGDDSVNSGLLARLAEFVGGQRKSRREVPRFWVDASDLRRAGSIGSGAVTACLAFPSGKPIAGVAVEIERFDLLGPSTKMGSLITDSEGNLTIICRLGEQRPSGLRLTSELDGYRASASYLI